MRRTLTAAALAAALAAPAAATASTSTAALAYPGAAEGWSGQLSPGFVGCAGALATWCPAPGALHVHAAARGALAAWSAANLVLAAPPATTIAAADLTLRYRTRDGAVHARVETSTAAAGSSFAVTLLPDAATATTRTVHLAGSGLRRIAAALATDAAVPAGRIASAAENALDVTAARVTLTDGVAPVVALVPPRAGGWYRGRDLPAGERDRRRPRRLRRPPRRRRPDGRHARARDRPAGSCRGRRRSRRRSASTARRSAMAR